jgi:hypothetical protein
LFGDVGSSSEELVASGILRLLLIRIESARITFTVLCPRPPPRKVTWYMYM